MKETQQQHDEQVNEIRGFSMFNEISSPRLRAFNRSVMIKNLKEDYGKSVATEYITALTTKSRLALVMMFEEINEFGWGEVNRRVINRMEVQA